MFINLSHTGKSLVNLDHVREMRCQRSEDKLKCDVTVIYSDGSERDFRGVSYLQWCSLGELSCKVVAATPGFFQLRFWFNNDEPNIEDILRPQNREPVIAWRIDEFNTAEPIGLESNVTTGSAPNATAILQPNDIVISPEDRSWPNIYAWAKDVCAEWKAWNTKHHEER